MPVNSVDLKRDVFIDQREVDRPSPYLVFLNEINRETFKGEAYCCFDGVFSSESTIALHATEEFSQTPLCRTPAVFALERLSCFSRFTMSSPCGNATTFRAMLPSGVGACKRFPADSALDLFRVSPSTRETADSVSVGHGSNYLEVLAACRALFCDLGVGEGEITGPVAKSTSSTTVSAFQFEYPSALCAGKVRKLPGRFVVARRRTVHGRIKTLSPLRRVVASRAVVCERHRDLLSHIGSNNPLMIAKAGCYGGWRRSIRKPQTRAGRAARAASCVASEVLSPLEVFGTAPLHTRRASSTLAPPGVS